MKAEDVIKNCRVEGCSIKLPDEQLDRKIYMEVAKKLQLIGGAWKGGKIQAFVFKEDPAELLASIQCGEKRNLQKEYQFFGTPDSLADELVRLADINPESVVLEPSAGQAAIIKAIQKEMGTDFEVFYCELMPTNQIFLKKIGGAKYICDDFLEIRKHCELYFDRIVANPPFSKNQDIEHVKKMWECLSPKGRIVTITSSHWVESSNKKEKAFREWLEKVGAKIIDIPQGSFKDSGTMVGGKILVIDRK